MWDERYATADYIFGTEPAEFLRRASKHLPPASRILSLAEGEGRNAVWLAGQGHVVTGLDQSKIGLAKAARLAAARGVKVALRQGDVTAWDGADGPWDAVLAVFVHFHPPAWSRLAQAAAWGLRPGGLFLYHGYGPGQLAYRTGGPSDPDMLPDAATVSAHFAGWPVVAARDHEANLAEGTRHVGRSALVDVILRAPGSA